MEVVINKSIGILKSLWLFAVAALIMTGNSLPVPVLMIAVVLALSTPLIREFRKHTDLDERQIQIGHFSSHIAYFVFSALLLFVLIKENFSTGFVEFYWYVLLFVPMILKLFICTVQSYGPVQGGFKGIFCVFFRGIIKSKTIDERQHDIGNFSSHLAFYLFTALTLFFIIFIFSDIGKTPTTVWFMLLLVPLIVKLLVSLFKTYGLCRGARFVCYTITGFWLLFVLLSHGFSTTAVVEASPFIFLLLITYLSKRFQLIAGLIFLILGILPFLFFTGWNERDIYFRILMYSLIPFPILLSSISLLIDYKTGEKND